MQPVVRSSLRVLGRADLAEALAVCDQDPLANVFVAARLFNHGITRAGGGELWGYYDAGRLASLCWSGANLIPVQASPDAADAFAARARRVGRHCSSIVGPAPAVLRMWSKLSRDWGPGRDVRADQPLMAIEGPPLIDPDPLVRPTRHEDLDVVLPACVAMFTEEVGYSPVAGDGGSLYRSQVSTLILAGRSLARVESTPTGRQVAFKAELGSTSPRAVQVQGVWVNPLWRGTGLAAPGMAAVVEHCRRRLGAVTTLYVNGYNTRAVRVYERVGFTQLGTFATILF